MLGLLHRIEEGLGVVWLGRAETELAREILPRRSAGFGEAEISDRVLRVRAELVIAHRELGWRRAHDPVVLRQEMGFGQVKQPGEKLSLSQISGRAEQHYDMVIGDQAGFVISGVHATHSVMRW